MPENDYIEQVPIQRESTTIKKPLLDTGQRKIKVKEDKQAMEIAHQILSDAKAKSNRTANGRFNTDYPLQVEHPELLAIPAAAEIKAAGLVPGMFRFAVGTITGNEIGKQSTNIGQKIDSKLGTSIFAPTFGFIGGLGGYAFGSGFTGNMLSRIPRKYSYGPTNERTYWAEDQTPKYNSSQITGHFGKVKYYGPTMGKTTAVASNPKLVDFDDIIRQPSRTILDRYRFRNKSEMYNSGNREAIKAYEDMLVKTLRDWRANPENSNLTLVASPTAIANPSNTGFYFDNIPSIPSRNVFIARNIGRGGTPEASALWYDSLIKKNPNLKIDDRFVSQIESKSYQSPSIKILDPQSDGNALRPFVLGRKPMYSVITRGPGHDTKVIEEADSAIGPDVIKLDYTRPMTGLHGETYQQGMRFYVNPNKLKEVIGQFQDLYKARLRLPEHWNTNQIYNYIIQHPEKVDVKLGETPQDIVGLNLGFGIKDAMLFADGKLEDFGGVYKRTVPNWYTMLKKRLDSGNLKMDHGTFNGDHITWKFNWGMMDDWVRKQAPKIPLPETKDIIQTSPKNFASGITLQENVPVNDDIAKIATAIAHPGTFSSMAQYGLDKSKEIFTSPWMRIRLQNMGYSDSEIKNYIQDRLKQMDTSKLSIADDLENVHELTAFKNGNIRIGEADPVLIGENYNLLNTSPFNQAIIQATKRGDVVGTIQHEIAGHGTEFPGFEVDKSGNSIYDGVELTNNGIQATIDKKLDDEYYISPDEQRARYLPIAQQMYDTGFDPNSESDFYKFLEFHKSDPETTQTGQLAKYYNWKSVWPAFSKARALIPFGLIGLSQIPQNNKNQK